MLLNLLDSGKAGDHKGLFLYSISLFLLMAIYQEQLLSRGQLQLVGHPESRRSVWSMCVEAQQWCGTIGKWSEQTKHPKSDQHPWPVKEPRNHRLANSDWYQRCSRKFRNLKWTLNKNSHYKRCSNRHQKLMIGLTNQYLLAKNFLPSPVVTVYQAAFVFR